MYFAPPIDYDTIQKQVSHVMTENAVFKRVSELPQSVNFYKFNVIKEIRLMMLCAKLLEIKSFTYIMC